MSLSFPHITSMVEGTHYGDSLTVSLADNTTVIITLDGGVLTAETCGEIPEDVGCDSSTIPTKIDTLARYTRWTYLSDRVFRRLTFALFNLSCSLSSDYFEYTPSKGLSRCSSSQYKTLKHAMYQLSTKPPRQLRPPTRKIVDEIVDER
ncbi:YALIH222S01e26104g1_1 [Yarrowia lipolytica]|jgi:hypothetical protein|nr:YALIH222S01e26104g1_1 [Yarrowia lipolytica]